MKLVRTILSLVFISVYLSGITGIFLFSHTCNYSHKTSTAFIFLKKAADPCGMDITADNDGSNKLEAQKCCNYSFSLLKNSTNGFPVSLGSLIDHLEITYLFLPENLNGLMNLKVTGSFTENYSPPPRQNVGSFILFLKSLLL
jgi:hypothetical protein